jgi:hypothetical protein
LEPNNLLRQRLLLHDDMLALLDEPDNGVFSTEHAERLHNDKYGAGKGDEKATLSAR